MEDAIQQEPRRPLRIFICYSLDDSSLVSELYDYLKLRCTEPWMSEKNLLPGQKWEYEIEKAAGASDVVLICLSKISASKAGYLNKEVGIALSIAERQPDDAIFIIPVRLEGSDVPKKLRDWQWVDLFEPSGHERLVEALSRRASELGLEMPTKNLVSKLIQDYDEKKWDRVIELGEHILMENQINDIVREKTAHAYYHHRGAAYLEQGDYNLALKDFDRAIQLDPKNSLAYVYRARAHEKLEQYDAALADFNRAIELDSQSEDVHVYRGVFYLNQGNYILAIQDLDTAIQISPKQGFHYCKRGTAYKLMGDKILARKDYQMAVSLGHEHAEDELKKLKEETET